MVSRDGLWSGDRVPARRESLRLFGLVAIGLGVTMREQNEYNKANKGDA